MLFIAAFVVAFMTVFCIATFLFNMQESNVSDVNNSQIQTEDTSNAPLPVIPEGGGYAGSSSHGI